MASTLTWRCFCARSHLHHPMAVVCRLLQRKRGWSPVFGGTALWWRQIWRRLRHCDVTMTRLTRHLLRSRGIISGDVRRKTAILFIWDNLAICFLISYFKKSCALANVFSFTSIFENIMTNIWKWASVKLKFYRCIQTFKLSPNSWLHIKTSTNHWHVTGFLLGCNLCYKTIERRHGNSGVPGVTVGRRHMVLTSPVM